MCICLMCRHGPVLLAPMLSKPQCYQPQAPMVYDPSLGQMLALLGQILGHMLWRV
jgi:hypothetical protein